MFNEYAYWEISVKMALFVAVVVIVFLQEKV